MKSFSKRIAVALALVVLASTQMVWADCAIWDGSMVRLTQGSGSEEDPFLINTAEEMAYLIRNYDYNEGICYQKFYKLTNDLDMRSTQWTFGSATSDRKSFRAHFNGDGHKISNIEVTLKDSPGECHYGLFPQLGGDPEFNSVIENLEIENVHFVRSTGDATGTYNFRIGGLVGKMYSNSRISNCLVHGFTVTDYATDVNLHPASRISACPLVGEILDYFGSNELYYEQNGIVVDHSYGFGSADLSHFHGTVSQFHQINAQGYRQPEGFTINGYAWHNISDDESSFYMLKVDIGQMMNARFQYEAIFNRGRSRTYTYHWVLDGERIGNYKSSQVYVEPKPYLQRLSLTIYDNGIVAGSGAILIEPDQYSLSIDPNEDPKLARRGNHRATASMTTASGLAVNMDDFIFSWQDMNDNFREVSNTATLENGQDGHTYLLLATHKLNSAAKFSIVKSYARPIYVCNRGIALNECETFTNDNRLYRRGDDMNDGRSPEHAVRTLKRAYELLKTTDQGGSIGTNVIVIMGDYSEHDFTEYMDNRCTRVNPNYFPKNRPALITGRYDGFRNGRMLFAGLSIKFDADTRFEQINLHGSSFEISDPTDQAKVFANGHNLTMGYGLFVSGYKIMDYTLGLDEGVLAPTITLYGGVLNNNDPNHVPSENTVTVLSGTYGRIIAGDGYTLQMERTGNISGSPQHPIRTRVVCDASNYYNPYHNQYDVALLIGGQADGTVFADTRIEVKGNSRIGRIVGGNVGFGRLVQGRPADSFFGKTDVTVTGGEITEIYGTNLGRYGHILYANETEHDSCVTYFYGKSYLNLLGGVIYNTVYGGGAASVSGFDYDALNHTADPHLPYWKDGKIAFGTYEEALGKMPIVQLRDEPLDLTKTEMHVNVGGDVHIMGSLYGGSVSFSSLLPTHQAGCQSGCIFADTYVNMNGGTIDGFVFGGCRGNLAYFDNSDHSSYPYRHGVQTDKLFFSRMGQMYGNSHVTITGGEVKGIIYGGGEGTYYRATSIDDASNAVDLMGTTYGTTQVNIGGEATIRNYIFGAGNYAHVYRTGTEKEPQLAGCVELNIYGGNMYAAAFGAGHGNRNKTNEAMSIYTKIAGDVHVNVTGGKFHYSPERARYIDRRIYGILCGGIATSSVRGDTYMNIEANPFPEELVNNSAINPDEDLIMSSGGYSNDCAVVGTAHIVVDSKDADHIRKIYMGGIHGTAGGAVAKVLSGKITNLYGYGHDGMVSNNNIVINVGVEGDTINNQTIFIDNIFGGASLKKTKINIADGCNVSNVLRAL